MYKILTFNIPDTENRSFVYSSSNLYLGELSNGEIPNISGSLQINPDRNIFNGIGTGPFYSSETEGQHWATNSSAECNLLGGFFDASRCSSVYRNNVGYVRPRSIIRKSVIKY